MLDRVEKLATSPTALLNDEGQILLNGVIRRGCLGIVSEGGA